MSESGAATTPQERAAALAFLQNLASEVSEGTIDLPCFPDVVIRISTALADPKTTADQVVMIVGAETDGVYSLMPSIQKRSTLQFKEIG